MTKLKQFTYRVLCGFFLGFSAFAPGFSGSVMAIMMGIYQDLIRILSNPLKQIKDNIRFFIPLLLGALLSFLLFVWAFELLFETYERATLLLFVGLMAGNLPVIFRTVRTFDLQGRYLVGGALSFALALGMGIAGIGAARMTLSDNMLILQLAISGFIAGAITLVPGMSISAILIMLGVYGYLIAMGGELLRLNFSYLPELGILLACAIIGLVLTSRGIKRVFERHPGFANTCVLGFMMGTLIGIFIESLYVPDPNFTWPLGGIALAAGLGVSWLFLLLSKKMNQKTDG